ncbi:MAG: gamma-glutamyl-gamma-aminobutyrate hydrolase family protein [Thermoleophilaceae bacterium]|nr:gamma-glutamyl-gamma-aminobutyrate hydrolase family protein [Thermoleophilaceae bacterium]
MRPVIGICAALERVRWGPWEEVVAMMPTSYVHAVQAAGGLALVLPPDDAAAADPDALIDRLDALILAGGADVDPAAYGARPHPRVGHTVPERDRFELALAHRALERDLPLLGICRGMELLNVARGGTLVQHVPDLVGHEEHRHTLGQFADHDVELEPGSLAALAARAERFAVKSHHHQGVDELGEGLEVTGWSIPDRLAEAVEDPRSRFVLGVLWHPERDESSRFVAALVEEARTALPPRRS